MKKSSQGRIAHLVFNTFREDEKFVDARVLRSALASSDVRDTIIIAMHNPGLLREESLLEGITVFRVLTFVDRLPKSPYLRPFKFLGIAWHVLRLLRRHQVRVLHANDLLALPVAVIAKILFRISFVYDSHEYFRNCAGLRNSKILYRVAMWTERIGISMADRVVTVSPGIAERLETVYSMNAPVHVVRNVPLVPDPLQAVMQKENGPYNGGLRKHLAIPDHCKALLYIGIVSKGRGVMLLCEMAKRLQREDYVLVILGWGEELETCKAFCERYDLTDKVLFPALVPNPLLIDYIRTADAGLCPIEGVHESHYYCLPNKLFEYIAAGLPVLSSDLPDLQDIVRGYGIGELFIPRDLDSLCAVVEAFLDSGREPFRLRLREAAQRLSWNVEAGRLKKIYHDCIDK